MLDWGGSGQSVMEMSHRGKDFIGIAAAAEANLRQLLDIPSSIGCCSCKVGPRCSSR